MHAVTKHLTVIAVVCALIVGQTGPRLLASSPDADHGAARDALQALYRATGGANWENKRYWLSAATDREFYLADGNDAPVGIWSDGATMWVADIVDGRLYAYDLATGVRAADRVFDLVDANQHPRGIWSDGATMWVMDDNDERFYVYDLATGVRMARGEFDLVGANQYPRGIWSDGATMWVADSVDGRLYAYDLATGARAADREFDLVDTNDAPMGIWSDGATMWVADIVDGRLYAYDLATGVRAADREFYLADGNDAPWGIWSDGATMWVADVEGDRLYVYDLATGARAARGEFDLADAIYLVDANQYPRGIWSDGATMWVVDYDDERFYVYDLATGVRMARREFDLVGANQHPQDIWSDGATMWVVDSNDDRFYVYDLATGVRMARGEFDLVDGNDAPAGIWSDGATMWVADVEGDRLYAYDLATGARAADRGIYLVGANQHPQGIWSDGATMWVVDSNDGRLYAYDLATGASAAVREFYLVDTNDAPLGIWSDGATMWVADSNDGRLYAYDLATGARAADRYIYLAYGNDAPVGIWSDGATMWVADYNDERFYVYDLATGASAPTAQPALTAQGTQPPASAPTLTLQGRGKTQCHLAWTEVSGATGYKLFRYHENSDTTQLVADNLDGTVYTDGGLTTSDRYFYTLQAVADGASGADSNRLFCQPDPREEDAPPGQTALEAQAASATAVMLTWKAVPGASGYELQRSDDGGGSFAPIGGALTATAYTDDNDGAGLTTGTAYAYRVRAGNDAGAGAWSNTAQVRPENAAPTAASAQLPTGAPALSVQSTSATSVTLAWTDVTGASGYELERCSKDEVTANLLEFGIDELGDHLTTAAIAVGVKIVAAKGAILAGAKGGAVVGAAGGAAAAGVGAVPGAIIGAAVGAVVAYAATSAIYTFTPVCIGFWGGIAGADGVLTATAYTDSGVTSEEKYWYRARAKYDDDSVGDWSNTVRVKPGAPTLDVTDLTSASVRLAWTPLDGVSGYEVIECQPWRPSLLCNTRSYSASASAIAYDGLTIGKTYEYRVRVKDEAGDAGDWSDLVRVMPGIPFHRPTLTAQRATATTVRFSWSEVEYATGYALQRMWVNEDLEMHAEIIADALTGTEYIYEEIEDGNAYFYVVYARNELGEGPWSSMVVSP